MALITRHACTALALGILAASPLSHAHPLSPTVQATPFGTERWAALIAKASQRFGVPQAWIGAVVQAESGGNPQAVSPKGAMGLMQIMPQTWADLRRRYRLGTDPFDPHDNVFAGTAYLRELYDRYGYPDLFAAYNAGPTRFDAYLVHQQPLPEETVRYLARLVQPVFLMPGVSTRAPIANMFFPLRPGRNRPATSSLTPSSSSLFVPLQHSPKRP